MFPLRTRVVCASLLALACAATLPSPASSRPSQARPGDRALRASRLPYVTVDRAVPLPRLVSDMDRLPLTRMVTIGYVSHTGERLPAVVLVPATSRVRRCRS
jgi:hypothetical protein